MPTIKDVAKRAGVSIATVSRVLNNKGNPTEKVKKRVLEAAKAVGYTTNIMARSLKSGSTSTICIFTPSYYLVNMPELIQSTCKMAQRSNYYTELILDADPNSITSLLKMGKYDGAIIVDPKNTSFLREIAKININFVIIGNDIDREDINTVDIDYFQGGYISTEKLISLGHKNILLLLDHPHNTITKEFRRGYLLSLDENGIQYSEDLIITPADKDLLNLEEFGYESIMNTIKTLSFTAVLSSSKRIAVGALNALNKIGLKIPNDVSFISLGNSNMLRCTFPEVSIIVAPFEQMGELGTEVLLNNITRQDSIIKKIKLQVQFIDRGSTARISKKRE
ncbi:MAG: hypothetical protein DRP54_05455 [Spirochaetes bacterium]|nr:MAG: hypothetical protein DRP54_05455 [Spirochaetota bacterium]